MNIDADTGTLPNCFVSKCSVNAAWPSNFAPGSGLGNTEVSPCKQSPSLCLHMVSPLYSGIPGVSLCLNFLFL